MAQPVPGADLTQPRTDPGDALAGPRARLWRRPAGALLLAAGAVAMMLFLSVSGAVLRGGEAAGSPPDANTIGAPDSFTHWFALQAIRDGRSPYSDEVTVATQTAIWGRPLGTQRQAFYYPVPVLLWYVPTLALDLAGAAAYARLLGLVSLGVALALSLRLARLPLRGWPLLAAAGALLTTPTVSDQYHLGQNTSVALALALSTALLYRAERYGWAGLVFALALVKPQSVLVLAVGLGLHALASRRRWSFLLTCGLGVAGLITAGLTVVPDWPRQWLQTLSYHNTYDVGYLQGLSGEQPAVQWLIRLGLCALLLLFWWRHRALGAGADWYPVAVAGALAVTMVAFTPSTSFYNLILLGPALVLILFTDEGRPVGLLSRVTLTLNLLIILLPPLLAAVVYAVYRLSPTAEVSRTLTIGVTLVAVISFYQGLAVILWLVERLLPARLRHWSPGRAGHGMTAPLVQR